MRARLRLVPPQQGRSPNWRIRGTHLGGSPYATYVDCSTGTPSRTVAAQALAQVKRDIERGKLGKATGPTFVTSVAAYLDHRIVISRNDRVFLRRLVLHFGETPVAKIDQAMIDEAAIVLYPDASPVTRNRQVYSPISAVLRHNGIAAALRRPKGAQGRPRRHWLRPEEAEMLLSSAWQVHARFAALITVLLYGGCRLSEALSLQISDVHLDERFADLHHTKNGEPQRIFLPPIAVQAIRLAMMQPANATWTDQKLPRTVGGVFRLTKSGTLYKLLNRVEAEAVRARDGIDVSTDTDEIARLIKDGRIAAIIPPDVSFHIYRHTFGAWTRGAGVRLEETGRWTSRGGAKPYDHYEITDAGRVADKFPGALALRKPPPSVAATHQTV